MTDFDLDAWLAAALPGERITARRELSGGHNNHNELLETIRGRYVLRRYRGQNACAKETALATRLAGIVPVPAVIAADPGAGVMLSQFVPSGGRLDGFAAGATLAAIGSVSFAAPGFLDDTLEPSGTELTTGLDEWVDRCLQNGNPPLTPDERDGLMRYATRATADLTALAGSRRLVHADYNPKNLLAAPDGGVAAVLDWEYAFSSTPLFDVANMLRDPRPPAFADAFITGFQTTGGDLPPNWRELCRALDLYSLADFLTRPPDHPYYARTLQRIRSLLSETAP